MKKIILVLAVVVQFQIQAQRKITPTESFTVKGKVKSEMTFNLNQLDNFARKPIADKIIYNHKGEVKDTVKNMKGVLLADILAKIEYQYDKPRELSEFYFVCTASDGYKVVFSWNEIYKTEIGNNLYIITEIEGKAPKDMEQRILLFATSDIQSGRRYVKGLETIEVRRAE
jgi:hypothetical protein